MDLGAGTVLRTVLPGLIDTTINIFDVSPIETTNTMHNAVDVRHTHADLQPVVSRANHFDRRCCCDNLIVMPRCTCALAAAAQSAPGQRIDGRKGLAAACVFTNWRWTRPTCAFLRTTTMQVVQQTLVCASASAARDCRLFRTSICSVGWTCSVSRSSSRVVSLTERP
jgi:hypothetical protein